MRKASRIPWATAIIWVLALLGISLGGHGLTSTPVRSEPLTYEASCQTFTSTDVPKTIPDNNPLGASSAITLTNFGYIQSITVTVTLDHPWWSDLSVELCRPNGCWSTLYDGYNRRYNILSGWDQMTIGFSDQSSLPMDRYGDLVNGTVYQPSEPINPVNLRASGVWKLKAVDHASSDAGSIVGWEMTLCSGALRPTVTPTFTLTPSRTPTNTSVPATDTPVPFDYCRDHVRLYRVPPSFNTQRWFNCATPPAQSTPIPMPADGHYHERLEASGQLTNSVRSRVVICHASLQDTIADYWQQSEIDASDADLTNGITGNWGIIWQPPYDLNGTWLYPPTYRYYEYTKDITNSCSSPPAGDWQNIARHPTAEAGRYEFYNSPWTVDVSIDVPDPDPGCVPARAAVEWDWQLVSCHFEPTPTLAPTRTPTPTPTAHLRCTQTPAPRWWTW